MQIRSQSKASGSGLCEGDEVVSINGSPCADLTYPQVIKLMESVTDSLRMLVKRPASGINETLISETENKSREHLPHEGYVESTTLQIRPAAECQSRESCVTLVTSGAPRAEDQGHGPSSSGSRKEETSLSCQVAPHVPDAPRGTLAEEPAIWGQGEVGWLGPVLELQLSLSQEGHKGTSAPVVTLLGAEKSQSLDPDPNLHHSGTVHINSVPTSENTRTCGILSSYMILSALLSLHSTAQRPFFLLDTEVSLQGHAEAFKCLQTENVFEFKALFAVFRFTQGTDEGKRNEGLRRSESLSEKQVKEARSKCRSIALLLTAAPTPHSRGVLMFKKRRRRARKFTLVSYGTGQLGRQDDPEDPEGGDGDDPFDGALLGASESDADADADADGELLSDADDAAQVVSFDWDSGLGDIEKKLSRGDTMEMLPDTAGKGVLMFARRRDRMDQIAAQEEDRAGAGAGPGGAQAAAAAAAAQSSGGAGPVGVTRAPGHAPQQNGFMAPAAALRAGPVNRTARPFPGPGAGFPAPPPYSAVTPPPDGLASPAAGPAQPPPWPQPAPWCPPAFPDRSERLASRDERIAVPAKRTGILQEAKRRSAAKPMFTFKEPKVSPNPELLSLLQNSEGKRGAGPGGDSGPEEDYLSLGAEACNFMQSPSAKQKTPPPVAPKPAVKASPSQPATPASPVWSPGVAAAQPPAFPAASPSQGTVVSSIKIAQPSYAPARPASALHLSGPFKGPQAAVASLNCAPKPPAPAPAVAPSPELPAMSGKGAQLFAKRQSRMEKYVVDSDTVQAHAARAQSPTASLPAGWKYSPNVRAPPPLAYNPIHTPSYPPAALKSQASAPQASKTSKKKGKKPLNALDVMKHQPYQLNASLFTFQPPDAKAGLPQRPSAKAGPGPATKQALAPGAGHAGAATHVQAASVYSVPACSAQPAFVAEATSPGSASPVPGAVPSSPTASASYFVAPRPKFSAKKGGVAAQERGRPLSLPGRPVPAPASAASPWAPRPAWPTGGPQRATQSPTPREAAAEWPRSPADDVLRPRSIQDSIVATVVSAARRKVLPGPSEGRDDRRPWVPQARKASEGPCAGREDSALSSSQGGSRWPRACSWQPARNDREATALETRSDCGVSGADGSSNPHPRGWRCPT
ncbi:synaptopodin-2 [Pteropus vampyrus]|uniref:Synaptopodin-2 n=1 Tax=Pteropus vampyrus TaxID=132908 RepID=A0A6P6CZI9_PTEVA|nr:synaptopodin-2 [Pteropus vampyrus]